MCTPDVNNESQPNEGLPEVQGATPSTEKSPEDFQSQADEKLKAMLDDAGETKSEGDDTPDASTDAPDAPAVDDASSAKNVADKPSDTPVPSASGPGGILPNAATNPGKALAARGVAGSHNT